jgi:hypothetical protein
MKSVFLSAFFVTLGLGLTAQVKPTEEEKSQQDLMKTRSERRQEQEKIKYDQFNQDKKTLEKFMEEGPVQPDGAWLQVPSAKPENAAPAEKVLVVEDDPDFESSISKRRLIYGPTPIDSRIEIRDLNPRIDYNRQIIARAESVGMVIEKEMLHLVTDSIYQLDISSTLKATYNLCAGEPFENQPVIGVGTAFIVAGRTLVSAAHVFSSPANQYAVVFGFEMVNKVGAYESFIPARNVYFPTLVKRQFDNLDLAIVEVDRMFDRPALELAPSFGLSDTTAVYMIGYPSGLPEKAALNAGIKENTQPEYFYTSLDAFQGNSGSPVFRLQDHTVIGVLVSGAPDFRWTGHCNVSNVCKIPYCAGEKVIRIEPLLDLFFR